MLTNLERYNGLGYAAGPLKGKYPPMPSPYVWAGTNQQVKGKYVRDGVFDPNHMDTQLGVAGLILTMMQLDPSIKFDGPAPQVQPKPISAFPDKPVRDGIWLQNSLNRLGASPKLELDGIVGPGPGMPCGPSSSPLGSAWTASRARRPSPRSTRRW
jgi:hypothetical protein